MRAFWTILAATGAIAVAASAGPAFAAGFTLSLSADTTPVVGRPMVLEATGTVPAESVATPYFFSLDVFPVAVTTTCPADHAAAADLVARAGGNVLAANEPEDPDATGSFATPIDVRPTGAGSVLLCAYIDDGTTTLATASLSLDIKPAPPTGRRATIPEEARAGIRGCRALLSHPASCIRRVVRQADARCRRLPTERRRAACLRAVRRVAARR
jgi:hypothetical protein